MNKFDGCIFKHDKQGGNASETVHLNCACLDFSIVHDNAKRSRVRFKKVQQLLTFSHETIRLNRPVIHCMNVTGTNKRENVFIQNFSLQVVVPQKSKPTIIYTSPQKQQSAMYSVTGINYLAFLNN